MNKTVGEGKSRSTYRDYLESMARQGDPEAVQELADLPPLPHLAAHLWTAFVDLHSTRAVGMGASRLSRLEIHAWEHDEGQRLERWERRAIMAIDAAWVRIVNEDQAKKEAAT